MMQLRNTEKYRTGYYNSTTFAHSMGEGCLIT